MDFKDVNIWLMLASDKNITKTAEHLYLSQPALTNRIKKMEAEFNTPLLIRSHSGVQFTPAGQKMIRHCQILKNDYATMQSDLFSNVDELHGSLTIGVTSIFARYRLPEILKSYLAQNPQVKISVRTGRSWDVYPLLKNQETPVAILREGYAWNDGKQLLTDEPLCIASRKDLDFDDLTHSDYVQYKTDPYLNDQISHWYNERFSTLPSIRMTASNIDTALAFVKAGLGWSIFPQIVLDHFDGYVRPLTWLSGRPFNRSTWLCYYKESLLSPVISSFVNYVEQAYQTDDKEK
ncbi:LysR family transcriptional regulator [Secundilactobacillus yichangensis]|uniref:LysR family transcriptional regulator n=1 Tax=Secundilactobacillus yichangensis TaxID=2799580 RepID=UPI001941E2C9|nr:LysR family transcriptional regulator [Secundilactobacillus yichangensis]